jgi:DNA-binding MarR family transcriptional regulator
MQEQIRSELTTWLNQSTGRTLHSFLSCVREQGLTLRQMNLLMILHYRGPCEITRLVEPLQVGKSAVSQMVERLSLIHI